MIATGLLLSILFGNQKTEFEHAAIDSETSVQSAMYRGVKIHGYDALDVPPMLKGWQQRGGHPFVLMLGNSQLHAINQMRPGDQCAPAILGNALIPRGLDVLIISPPNASLMEHYILFEYVCSQAVPSVVSIGVCCDDTRNDEVRAALPLRVGRGTTSTRPMRYPNS